MRILIVEDEIRIRKGIAKLIQHHTKHTVIGEARNGEEGMEMVRLHQPDLVITDIRMPQMDGLEMIRRLREEDGAWRFVILSGYSEFEYAKQALRYGAEDYLIKPLAPEDVIGLLDTVQEKIETERKKEQGKPEKKLRDYLIENELGCAGDLEKACGLCAQDRLRLVTAYVGNASSADKEWCLQRFEKLRGRFPEQKMFCFFTESTREFICLTEDENWALMEEELEKRLLKRQPANAQCVWVTGPVRDLKCLKEEYERLRGLYSYGLSLGYDTFLTEEKTARFEAEPYQYPKSLEHRLQKAFYQENREAFAEAADQFVREAAAAKVKPGQIKEGYMKIVDFMTNLAQENDQRVYEQLQNLNTIREIGGAVTMGELENVFREVAAVLSSHMNQRQGISNYTIKRAINYIRLHYYESISLEEVAAKLDITPEYLSTLFNRETGENFSVFLKKFRISHAKRLLKGTDKKIYEIAKEVGYGDPKYFNRVFKEEEGISPGDYRSLQK